MKKLFRELGTEKINLNSRRRRRSKGFIAMEPPVNIFVNDEYVITLLATPSLQKELALGWLFTERVIRSLKDVRSAKLSGDNVNVITKAPVEKENLRAVGATRIMTSSCGMSAVKFMRAIYEKGGPPIKSDYKIKVDDVVRMVRKFNELAKLHQLTKGVHVSVIFEDGRLVAFAEDVGRHNATDKAIGLALTKKANFSHCVSISSGRQPADMVLKASRSGIPIIVSLARPINSGIIVAKNTGITLASLADEPEIEIYTCPERILS